MKVVFQPNANRGQLGVVAVTEADRLSKSHFERFLAEYGNAILDCVPRPLLMSQRHDLTRLFRRLCKSERAGIPQDKQKNAQRFLEAWRALDANHQA